MFFSFEPMFSAMAMSGLRAGQWIFDGVHKRLHHLTMMTQCW
jgi:hypothetical protein